MDKFSSFGCLQEELRRARAARDYADEVTVCSALAPASPGQVGITTYSALRVSQRITSISASVWTTIALGISLADSFAVVTAERTGADLASFDKRVRRALGGVDVRLSPALTR